MRPWNELSMAEKADVMKLAIEGGVYDLNAIRSGYNDYARGGRIHIAPSKRGTFTAAASKHGKSVQAFASQVLAHPENYSPAMRKKANFARNASHWKHGLGGNLYPGGGFIGLMPAMPGIAIDSNAAENIATTTSKKVMNYIKGAHDTGSYFSYDPSMEAYTGPAQDTYLLPRKLQEKEFLRRGYIKGKDKDYGLVKRAVGDRDLPVYQRNPDAITRDNLTVIGNIHGWDPWYGSTDTALEHPGSYPTAVYTDAEGNFFQKGWDLNDYGGKTGSTIGFLSDIVDRIGSPTVVTTGYQPVSNPQDKNFIQAITPMMAKKGLVPTEINGKTEWVLPEVTITGKKKKALGGNLFGGTTEDSQQMKIGKPYYSYDENGRKIDDTLNYNISFPEIVITPDSRKSPAERAILERERRRNNDAFYGTGTYNAKADREQTELEKMASQKAWETSTEKQALDYAQAAATGIGIGADMVSGLPIYSSLKGARVLSEAETPTDYVEGALWLAPLGAETYQAAKPIIKGVSSKVASLATNATPKITAENAAIITPEQWDAAYRAAYERGDIAEGQRLWDLWFKQKAPNTKINVPLWTSSEEPFNVFDLSHFGETDSGFFGYGHYLTPLEKYAASYHPVNRRFYVNMENPYIGNNDQYFNRVQYVKDRLALRKENVMRNLRDGKLTRFSKKLGINENTSLEDAERLVDKYIADETVKWNDKYVKYADEFEGKDGVLSWRELQGVPNNQEGIYREVVVPRGEQIKSAEPFTLSDDGSLIPLTKRADFSNPDIRYDLPSNDIIVESRVSANPNISFDEAWLAASKGRHQMSNLVGSDEYAARVRQAHQDYGVPVNQADFDVVQARQAIEDSDLKVIPNLKNANGDALNGQYDPETRQVLVSQDRDNILDIVGSSGHEHAHASEVDGLLGLLKEKWKHIKPRKEAFTRSDGSIDTEWKDYISKIVEMRAPAMSVWSEMKELGFNKVGDYLHHLKRFGLEDKQWEALVNRYGLTNAKYMVETVFGLSPFVINGINNEEKDSTTM